MNLSDSARIAASSIGTHYIKFRTKPKIESPTSGGRKCDPLYSETLSQTRTMSGSETHWLPLNSTQVIFWPGRVESTLADSINLEITCRHYLGGGGNSVSEKERERQSGLRSVSPGDGTGWCTWPPSTTIRQRRGPGSSLVDYSPRLEKMHVMELCP